MIAARVIGSSVAASGLHPSVVLFASIVILPSSLRAYDLWRRQEYESAEVPTISAVVRKLAAVGSKI